MNQPLILASTSPHRRALLARLGLAFTVEAPGVDETARPDEPPQVLVLRLAEAKAAAVAQRHQEALIIGSDQVACIDNQVLGKPGNRQGALAQLERASGRTLVFQTGLCLLNAVTGRTQTLVEPFRVHFRRLSRRRIEAYLDRTQTLVEPFRVHFRRLSRRRIEAYLDREQPYDCAGSFKSEGLGIALFARLEGDDPSALIGLPLIRLVTLLESEGLDPLGEYP
jgi:septum formation protein